MARTLQEKRRVLKQKLAELEKTTDGLGMRLDGGIKETVAVFNLLGFPTCQSCAGHLDHGYPAPWVMFAAKGEPKIKFKGEKEIYFKFSKKSGYKIKDLKKPIDDKAFEIWKKIQRLGYKIGKTKEYKEWEKKNDLIYQKLWNLCKKFYSKNDHYKEVDKNTILVLQRGDGFIRIHNGQLDFKLSDKDLIKKIKKLN